MKRGLHPYAKTSEEYWRFTLEKYNSKFAKESQATKDKFFAELRELEKTDGSGGGPTQPPRNVHTTRRIVSVVRNRAATLADADSLAMYRCQYLDKNGVSHLGWQQYDPGSMEPLIRRDFAELMGCTFKWREPEDFFYVRGVSKDLLLVQEDALVKVKLPGARKVASWPSDPHNKSSPIILEGPPIDLDFEWQVPVLDNSSSINFLQGGDILEDTDMKHHFEQRLITLRHKDECYAIPMLSWAEAMAEARICDDPVVRVALKQDLEDCECTQSHVGVSKAFVLRKSGSVPIRLSKAAKKDLTGLVKVEIKSYGEEGIPITFEPTLCQADDIHFDVYTMLEGDVLLPERSIIATVTPVIKSMVCLSETST